jgi:hypothetical protein
MTKFSRYDFATKGYIAKLFAAANGEIDTMDLIPASAAVQDALSEIKDLNAADRDFVQATAEYIDILADIVKGKKPTDIDEREATYVLTRRRVIIEAPGGYRLVGEAA